MTAFCRAWVTVRFVVVPVDSFASWQLSSLRLSVGNCLVGSSPVVIGQFSDKNGCISSQMNFAPFSCFCFASNIN